MLLCPWDFPGKSTGVGCHFLLQCMKMKSEREVTQLCPTPSDPMDCKTPGFPVYHQLLELPQTHVQLGDAITSWQIDGETMETARDFIFLGSKITADGDCSHEIEMLTPWKKNYDQPRQHIKKQRHYLANKGPSS